MNINIRKYEYSPALKKVLENTEYKMSDGLLNVLNIERSNQKIGLSEERITEVLPIITEHISFWREYPDLFVDFLLPKNSTN